MNNNFGEYLRGLRKEKRLTLVQLSKLSGVSNPYLSQIENNKFIPSPDILRKLYRSLGVGYTTLLDKAGYMEDEEMLEIIKKEKKEKVYKLKGTESSFMVDLSNLGEGDGDLEEYLKITLDEPLFYGDTQLTTDEQSLLIDFIELLLKHRKDDNN